MALPGQLQEAVERELTELSAGGLRRDAEALTRHYRAGGVSGPAVTLPAYLTVRLPATYAAVDAVMQELRRRFPRLSPASMLDAGAGPGTASWAAAGNWPDLAAVTFLDIDQRFLALAQSLARSGPPALAKARCVTGSIDTWPGAEKADLVVAAYALAEMPLVRVAEAARNLWAAAGQALIVVEPGTPQGFSRIRAVRVALLAEGAVPAAPCTHASACPMAGDGWCHFSVRLQRSRSHMQAKSARLPFEDEKYSYLAVLRDGEVAGGARVIAPPFERKPGITFRLCTAEGLDTRHVARRDATAYKACRKTGWGDHFPADWENKE